MGNRAEQLPHVLRSCEVLYHLKCRCNLKSMLCFGLKSAACIWCWKGSERGKNTLCFLLHYSDALLSWNSILFLQEKLLSHFALNSFFKNLVTSFLWKAQIRLLLSLSWGQKGFVLDRKCLKSLELQSWWNMGQSSSAQQKFHYPFIWFLNIIAVYVMFSSGR